MTRRTPIVARPLFEGLEGRQLMSASAPEAPAPAPAAEPAQPAIVVERYSLSAHQKHANHLAHQRHAIHVKQMYRDLVRQPTPDQVQPATELTRHEKHVRHARHQAHATHVKLQLRELISGLETQ